MNTIKQAIIVTLLLTINGCASIAGDNTRTVNVVSKPSGAAIYVDNKKYGVTPANINLPTYIYGGKNITLKKYGYQEEAIMVNTQFQPIALLDILAWPTFFIDAATGSLVKIDPANLKLKGVLHRA